MAKPYARRTEAGSGGKLGHSNQTHWAKTEFIKLAADTERRHQDKVSAEEGLRDFQDCPL